MTYSLLIVVALYLASVVWRAHQLWRSTGHALPLMPALTVAAAQLHRPVVTLSVFLTALASFGVLDTTAGDAALDAGRADLWAAATAALFAVGAHVYGKQAGRHLTRHLPVLERAPHLSRLPSPTLLFVGALSLYVPASWALAALNSSLPGASRVVTADITPLGERDGSEVVYRASTASFALNLAVVPVAPSHVAVPGAQVAALHIKEGVFYPVVTHLQLNSPYPLAVRAPAGGATELQQEGLTPRMRPRKWLLF